MKVDGRFDISQFKPRPKSLKLVDALKQRWNELSRSVQGAGLEQKGSLLAETLDGICDQTQGIIHHPKNRENAFVEICNFLKEKN